MMALEVIKLAFILHNKLAVIMNLRAMQRKDGEIGCQQMPFSPNNFNSLFY